MEAVNARKQRAMDDKASAETTMNLIQKIAQETSLRQRKDDQLRKYKKRSMLMQKIHRLELLIPSNHGKRKAKEAQPNRWGRQVAAMDATTRR